ncbi:purine permease [Saccharopolyspora indica]|uniref:nucleobase:cation symporter-2 family protein n=1 Tax=Saccharopolyspora indica TaxID=1229659 RepID=UPI0022EB8E1D|nr:nucleobase:cation symporter-2 family protein [Saccharopolyspora indica]MDA3648506.1 nucleobase:cation symporter-2 family protein [Saccharopolyspora indica]
MVRETPSTSDLGVDDRPPWGHTILLGLQHVLVMYAGAVVVPMVVGSALGLGQDEIATLVCIDLVLAGIGTILQSLGLWKFGIRMPLVVGAASNGIVPMILIGQSKGLPTVYGSLLVGGVLWILLAPLFGSLLKLFPAVVTGTVITLIGLTLIPVGLRLIAGKDPSAPDYAAPGNLLIAGFTLLLVVVFSRFLRGLLGQLALLLALVVGAVVGWIAGMGDLSDVGSGPVLDVPGPFHYGMVQFDVPSILLFLIVVLVLTVEASGQGLAVGQVVGRKVGPAEISRLLRVDGLLTALSGIFSGFAYTTFGQNIGLIALTKVRSRYPVAVGGVILVLLGVVQPIGRLVAAIPQPVIGAVAVVTFAALTVSGIELLSEVDFSRAGNLVVVMVALGVGLVPTGAPDFYHQLPFVAQVFLDSGVATGTVLAVALNALFHLRRRPDA